MTKDHLDSYITMQEIIFRESKNILTAYKDKCKLMDFEPNMPKNLYFKYIESNNKRFSEIVFSGYVEEYCTKDPIEVEFRLPAEWLYCWNLEELMANYIQNQKKEKEEKEKNDEIRTAKSAIEIAESSIATYQKTIESLKKTYNL